MLPPTRIGLLMADNNSHSKIDASLSVGRVTAIAIGLTPIIAGVVLGLHCLVWGMHSLLATSSYFSRLQIILPAMAISVVAHEGLHWFGFVKFGHLSWRTVHFGLSVKSMTAYVHCDSPLSASAYGRLVALPGIVLGVVPVCIGIMTGAGWMTLYGFLMLIGASGDFAVLWRIRHVPPDSMVLDHAHRAGCWVLGNRTEAHAPLRGEQT